jgi:thioredoxin reductase
LHVSSTKTIPATASNEFNGVVKFCFSLTGPSGRPTSKLSQHRSTGNTEKRPIRSLFVMIGAAPNTGWLSESLLLDEDGFIATGTKDALELSRYATSVAGIFAIGDVRSLSVKRVASVVGEGSIVISDVH